MARIGTGVLHVKGLVQGQRGLRLKIAHVLKLYGNATRVRKCEKKETRIRSYQCLESREDVEERGLKAGFTRAGSRSQTPQKWPYISGNHKSFLQHKIQHNIIFCFKAQISKVTDFALSSNKLQVK